MPTVAQDTARSTQHTGLRAQHSALSTRESAKAQCAEGVVHGVHGDLQRLAATRGGPISAVELARLNGVHGNRESRRRIIRFAVEHLRAAPIGMRICGNNAGYWLARDNAEWEAYLEARKAGARFEFVRERRMREAARDAASGQGKLF